MNNRFAVLYVDEENSDSSPPFECLPTPVKAEIPSPISAFSKVNTAEKKSEKKSADKKKQPELRDFGNISTLPKKDIFNKKNPFRKSMGSRYAFKDDFPHKPLVSPIQAPYKFIDESVPLEPFKNLTTFETKEIKDSTAETIIFSSTIGNRVNSDPSLTSLYR